MSMITYPLNEITYSAEDAELFHCTRTSGIFSMEDFEISVSGSDYTAVIGKGIGWIRNSHFSGKVTAQKEPIPIDLGLPDSLYKRIDSIVIQFDKNKNKTEIIVKKGIAGEEPTPPELIRTDVVYELHLYQILREVGELSIVSDNIVDVRGSTYYCGIMNDGTSGGTSDIFLDDTLTIAGKAADAKVTGDKIAEAKKIATDAQKSVDDLPISVSSEGYTDINGLRQVTNMTFVKNDSSITLTTKLQGEQSSVSVVTLDDNGFPEKITTDGVECIVSWEGFD